MGKKTKKTKWRTLEISLPMPGKPYRENGTSSHLQWDEGWRASSNKYRPRGGGAGGGGGGGSCDNVIKTSARFNVCAQNSSSEENQHAKTLDEDEYTKITTPRQDVLFKKSYLTKRKALLHAGAGAGGATENIVDNHCTDGAAMVSVGVGVDVGNYGQEFCDYATVTADGDGCGSGVDGDISSLSRTHPQLVCATSQSYMDASSAAAAAIYYGGGYDYEIYDPYTGNVTAVVAAGTAAAATCQPILTSLPCRPVPLQSLQWFNPVVPSAASEWCGVGDDDGVYTQLDGVKDCAAVAGTGTDAGASKASYSNDSANVSEPASESSRSSCTTASTTRTTGGDDNLYASPPPPPPPHSYVYPGYVLGTPVYNLADDNGNGNGNLGYFSPASPILSGNESTTTKRKKKRKRRRRFGEAEEDSESGVEEYRQDTDSLSGNEYVHFDYTSTSYDPVAGCGEPHLDNSPAVNGFQPQTPLALENQLDHDHLGHQQQQQQQHHHHRRRHRTACSTLSYASINAPPFVPAKHAFVDVTQIRPYSNRLSECVLNVSDRCNGYDKPCATDQYTAATPSPSAAAAATSRDNRNDSPLSSGNSDSGIGSPANEDCVSKDGRDFAQTAAKAPAAVAAAADRSTNADSDGDRVSLAVSDPDIERHTWFSVSMVPSVVSVSDAQTIRADGHHDQESKKTRTKDTPLSKQCHLKNEESSVEPDATAATAAAESTITHENRSERCDGKAEDDDDGETNRKKRSNESTKISNRSQIAASTIVCVDDGRKVTSDSAPFEYKAYGDVYDKDVVAAAAVVVENDSLHPAPSPLSLSSDEPISTARVVDDENSRRDEGILIDRAANVAVIEEKYSSVESGRPSRFDRHQPTEDREKTFHDVNDSVVSTSSSSESQVEANSDDGSLESVVLVARTIVDEIVQQAALRIRTTTTTTTTEKCDKLRLPLTQAVTTWMNESGGLPAVVVGRSSDNRRPSSTSSVEVQDSSDSRPTRSKTTKSVESFNCVIC